MRAVANCVTSHSRGWATRCRRGRRAQAQREQPAASSSTCDRRTRCQVQRTPCSRKTTASRAPPRATAWARNAGMVMWASSAVVSPFTWLSPSWGSRRLPAAGCCELLETVWFMVVDPGERSLAALERRASLRIVRRRRRRGREWCPAKPAQSASCPQAGLRSSRRRSASPDGRACGGLRLAVASCVCEDRADPINAPGSSERPFGRCRTVLRGCRCSSSSGW
jgi:hypothetical protein